MSRPGILARGPIIPGAMPDPPDELTPEELAIWEKITSGLSAERVSDVGFQLLASLLCTHVHLARYWAAEASKLMRDDRTKSDSEKQRELRVTLREHGFQSDKVTSLSTKLRLTPQGRYFPDTADLKRTGSRPWEDWGDRRKSGN